MPNVGKGVKYPFIQGIIAAIRWYAVIQHQIWRLRPRVVLAIFSLSLLSETAAIVAFILPVKIVIMLGAPTIPAFFSSRFQYLDKVGLILAMSAMVLCAYLIHKRCRLLVGQLIADFSKALSKDQNKLPIFINQAALSETSLSKLAGSATSINTFILLLVILTVLYPNLSIFLMLLGLLTFCIFAVLLEFRKDLRVKFEEKYKATLQGMAPLGFICAFLFIVIDYLLPISPPHLMYAIVGLIFSRQLIGGLTNLILMIAGLYRDRERMHALFLQNQEVVPHSHRPDNDFWHAVSMQHRSTWINAAISEVLQNPVELIHEKWIQTGTDGVAAFEVAVRVKEGQGAVERRLLIKLFNERRLVWSENEEILLQDAEMSLLAPKYLGRVKVNKFYGHIFAIDNMHMVPPASLDVASVKLGIYSMLLECTLPDALVRRYSKSHPFVWQRVDARMLDRISAAADSFQMEEAEYIKDRLPDIQGILQTLPLRLVIPKLSLGSVIREDAETMKLKLISLSNWRIEPLGYGWGARDRDINNLMSAVDAAALKLPLLGELPKQAILLSALIAAFENLFQTHKWIEALDALPGIRQALEGVDKESSLVGGMKN